MVGDEDGVVRAALAGATNDVCRGAGPGCLPPELVILGQVHAGEGGRGDEERGVGGGLVQPRAAHQFTVARVHLLVRDTWCQVLT